jgi:hypothetical protein
MNNNFFSIGCKEHPMSTLKANLKITVEESESKSSIVKDLDLGI